MKAKHVVRVTEINSSQEWASDPSLIEISFSDEFLEKAEKAKAFLHESDMGKVTDFYGLTYEFYEEYDEDDAKDKDVIEHLGGKFMTFDPEYSLTGCNAVIDKFGNVLVEFDFKHSGDRMWCDIGSLDKLRELVEQNAVGDFKKRESDSEDGDESCGVTMQPLEVVLGKNVCAYGKFILPTGTDINPKAIKEACLAAEGDVLFTPDWSSGEELRIVALESDDGAIDYTGFALEPVPTEPEGVVKHLDLSTGHLTVETREWMSKADPATSHCDGITVAAYECGAFFSVPSEATTIDRLECPEDLKALLKYARKIGCDVVRVDTDGLILDHLPYYEGF